LWSDAVCVEFSFRRGFSAFLGEDITRSGETSTPKRDGVMLPLFHARSGEMIQLRRD